MPTHFPQAVPEIPVRDVDNAAAYYANDELFERWMKAGATIVEGVGDKPWNLRGFRAADPDGNQLRVFYDFNWELGEERRR